MRDFNRNNRSGGGRRGGRDFRRSSVRREMHKAVCDECGRSCEVPFRPSGDKPIYCSDCFERKEGGSLKRPSRTSSRGSGIGKRDDTNKQLLEQVSSLNTKLDRILKVIESGAEKKPVSKKAEVKKTEVKKVVKKSTSKDEAPRPAPHGVASSPPSRSKILPKQKRIHPRTTSLPRSSAKEDKKIETKKASKKEAEKSTPKD